MAKSLRLQILGLLSGSLVLVLLIALACFHFLSNNVQSYRGLLEGPLRSSQLVDEANLQFKIQVQEWKNMLIRGKSAADRDKYWAQFEEQERLVQDVLSQLSQVKGASPSTLSQVQKLIDEHKALGVSYRKGRDAFIAAGGDAVAGDVAVKGVDRAASEQMSQLVESLRKNSGEQSLMISSAADRTILFGALIMLASAILVGLVTLWVVNRNLITPIRVLIDYVSRLSRGQFGERVNITRQDELGHLAVAANILRDFLADTFSRLKSSTSELDVASHELKSIATLMA